MIATEPDHLDAIENNYASIAVYPQYPTFDWPRASVRQSWETMLVTDPPATVMVWYLEDQQIEDGEPKCSKTIVGGSLVDIMNAIEDVYSYWLSKEVEEAEET